MLSASDPYYVAKEEVSKAIEKMRGLHGEWKRLLQSDTARSQRFQQLHEEITGPKEIEKSRKTKDVNISIT